MDLNYHVVHTCNHNTQEAEEGDYQYWASLVYIVRS